MFLNPGFGTGAAAITVVFLATFALFYLIAQYIQQVLGFSALQTAFALSPLALPLLSLSLLSSWYLPRLGLWTVIFASTYESKTCGEFRSKLPVDDGKTSQTSTSSMKIRRMMSHSRLTMYRDMPMVTYPQWLKQEALGWFPKI